MIFPPEDCDLRDYPFLPLDVMRLRDSAIVDAVTGDEFRAAILLWCSCWHQVPAGSLPDDDAQLAKFAGYGRVVKEWMKVRAGALYGFVKGPDGRLYHSVIVEKALEAWAGRRSASRRGKAGAAKRWASRDGGDDGQASHDDSTANAPAISTDSSAIEKNGSSIDPAMQNNSKGEGEGKGERHGEGIETKDTSLRSASSDRLKETSMQPDLLGDVTSPPAEIVAIDPLRRAFEAYNLTVEFVRTKFGDEWKTARWPMQDARRKALKARIDQAGGIRGWCEAMRRAANSSRLTGRVQRSGDFVNWRPHLGFFLQAESFTRLLEGFYDDNPSTRSGGSGGVIDRALAAAAYAVAAGDPGR